MPQARDDCQVQHVLALSGLARPQSGGQVFHFCLFCSTCALHSMASKKELGINTCLQHRCLASRLLGSLVLHSIASSQSLRFLILFVEALLQLFVRPILVMSLVS